MSFKVTNVSRKCLRCGPEGTKCAKGETKCPKLVPDECIHFKPLVLTVQDAMVTHSVVTATEK